MKMNKNFFTLSIVAFFCSALFAEGYKIKNVTYNIQGSTKESALKRNFPVDTNRIFKTQDELNGYIEILKIKLNNERNFESSDVAFTVNDDESVDLTISVADSKHLLALPYPKYDSNSGISAKIKVKDTNFAGTLSELNASVYYETDTDKDDENKTNQIIGGEFEYRLPFRLGPVNATWNNRHSVNYTLEKSKPEFDANTGFTFELPLKNLSFVLDLNQQLSENFDYIPYDDEFFGRTTTRFSIPVTLSETKRLSKITYAPYILFDAAYDSNGIEVANYDLTGPELFAGHTLSFGQVNWLGNFRNGFTMTLDNSFGWNFQKDNFIPSVELEAQAFKAFSRFGMNARAAVFAKDNKKTEFGTRLRGIADKQYYDNYTDEYGFRTSSIKENCGIILNLDMPVSIFTTHFGKFFDFEFQVSPFADIALTSNQKTGNHFSLKDGYYAAGMEFLVYPLKWKSIVVRASAGFDLSKLLNFESGTTNTVNTWNKECKKYEIFIGIGWHY